MHGLIKVALAVQILLLVTLMGFWFSNMYRARQLSVMRDKVEELTRRQDENRVLMSQVEEECRLAGNEI